MSGTRFCEGCGAAVTAGAKFCESCGQALTASAAPGPVAPPPLSTPQTMADVEAAEPVGITLWVLAAFIPTVLFFIYWFAPVPKATRPVLLVCTLAFIASAVGYVADGWYPIIGMVHLALYWGALVAGRKR